MFLMSGLPCRAVAEESRASRQNANQTTGVAQSGPGLRSFKGFVGEDQVFIARFYGQDGGFLPF
ncbi:hypothetical protein RA28_19970 [Ruegeria sp. ANG-S4]|uniref:hypothetical protein n=1 Tax=Ruegeria sp. ANG-S4 TaxID=1577904 RepID=UPI00058054E8|nr:hypothetical protein [Ruegeria sp. ANG-S4]KIC41678.1 hypothetical protein RA28_19970 [Ruegeria sp. ANG-S4]